MGKGSFGLDINEIFDWWIHYWRERAIIVVDLQMQSQPAAQYATEGSQGDIETSYLQDASAHHLSECKF